MSAINLHAQLISVNFTSGETYSGGAAIGSANDVWNNLHIFGTSGVNSTFGLVNSQGTAVSTTLSLSGFSNGADPYGNYQNPSDTIAPNLFKSFIYGGSGTTLDSGAPGYASAAFDFAHLTPNTTYLLEVYTVNSAAFAGRDFSLTSNGVSETLNFTQDYSAFSSVETAPGIFSGNYIPFTLTSDAGGNLDISIVSTNPFDQEVDISGLQLEAPEPSTAKLLFSAIGLLLVAVAHKRRLQKGRLI